MMGSTRASGVALLGALAAAAGCPGPQDPGRTRPGRVRTTPFEQRDLRVLGLRLRYVDEGPYTAATSPVPGEPVPDLPVLLIPGHTSRIEEYDALVPVLARRRRVIAFDFPGSGYSDKPDRPYSLRLYEDAALGVLDALGVARAHLAGGSLGGNLVLRLAHRVPERFERLAPWAPGGAWRASPRVARAMRAVSSRAAFWPIVWIQSRYWYGPEWPGREAALADTFAYYREVLGPGFVRMYFDMAADQVERSLFDIAREIPHPVWLGWGDRDDGANMGAGVARLHGLLPRCELHVFPGARHSLAAEVPEALAAEIDEFLARPAAELARRDR